MVGHHYRVEPPTLRSLFSFALPMIVSQASETAMLFVDRLFLSRLGTLHIAASMSGGLSATRPLVSVFVSGNGPADQELVSLAVYTLADVTQLVFSGARRGAGYTKAVMTISVASHWVFAGFAVVGIRVLSLSPIRMWQFFILFVLSLGLMMALRFRRGRWRDLRVIEGPDTSPEVHKPKVVIESEWM